MVVKKAWMAVATLLAFAALPACAKSNVGTTATSATGTAAGGGDTGGGGSGTGGQGGEGGVANVCGDGNIATSEICDDGNTIDGDGCDAECKPEMGWDCKDAPSICKTKCGDGLLLGDELCDDGNKDGKDGCDGACFVEFGYLCDGSPSICATVCGDGMLAGAEECDDTNTKAADGCSDTCHVEKGWSCIFMPSKCTTGCGDGTIAGSEACDDHNFADGDGCSASCQVEDFWSCTGAPSVCATPCGDGQVTGTEVCDDNNTNNGDGCSDACKPEPGYTCTGLPSVCSSTCGDGLMIVGVELCDDGNNVNNDGCNALCKVEPGFICSGTAPTTCTTVCGDGYVAGQETCDVGPPVANDGCDSTCQTEHGYICNNFPSVCTTVCGDGIVGGAEQCDDGNNVGGDGCSPTCGVIQGYACAGEPSVCITVCGDGIQAGTEQCDDGNHTDGDCCSSTCSTEIGCEIEPNDTPDQALTNGAYPIGQIWKGAIKPIGDPDFYLVQLNSTSDLKIETFDGNGPGTCVGIDTKAFLFASDGTTQLAVDDDTGINNCSLIDPVTLAGARHLLPGDYYIRIQHYNGAGTVLIPAYRVMVTLSAVCGNGIIEGSELCDGPGGAPCDANCNRIPTCGDGLIDAPEQCDDTNTVSGDGCSSTCLIEGLAAEVEPNNNFAQATANALQITGDVKVLASISASSDKDYFAFSLATASTVRFETFEGTAPNCSNIATKINLYNSAQASVYSDLTTGILNCSALVVYLNAGNYFVEVEQATTSAAISSYLLEVKVESNLGNEAEPNDALATANTLPSSDVYIHGDHQVGGDLDYYAITVPAGKSVRAEIVEGDLSETCESNGIDSYLRLFTSAAATLASDDDSGRGFCSIIDGTGLSPALAGAHNLAAGTYYLQVAASGLASASGAIFNYRLAVTVR